MHTPATVAAICAVGLALGLLSLISCAGMGGSAVAHVQRPWKIFAVGLCMSVVGFALGTTIGFLESAFLAEFKLIAIDSMMPFARAFGFASVAATMSIPMFKIRTGKLPFRSWLTMHTGSGAPALPNAALVAGVIGFLRR